MKPYALTTAGFLLLVLGGMIWGLWWGLQPATLP